MTSRKGKLKVGIVGCGAIGTGMARGIKKDFGKHCQVTGLFDIAFDKVEHLAKELKLRAVQKKSIPQLIKSCDCMIEAVSAQSTNEIIQKALHAKKDVLAMSVGKLLNAKNLFRLAAKQRCHLLLPSGAIAGLDAIKAASLAGIDSLTLTTRKPLSGFQNDSYLKEQGIDINSVHTETVIFQGSVIEAVKNFPRNINVAATLALASGCQDHMIVRIITSPEYRSNSHEIIAKGNFGEIRTQTENTICPENPKTSYLAVLSGLQMLKQYSMGIFVGT